MDEICTYARRMRMYIPIERKDIDTPTAQGSLFFFLNVYILFCGIVAFRKRRCGGASVDKKLGHLTSSVCVFRR